ncbi:MAG: DMT family transporter [Candidatus Micrarchaeota archaeon]
MLGFLAILISSALGGFGEVIIKKTVGKNGVYRAIAYNYVGLLFLLIVGALISKQSFSFPIALIIPYLIQVLIGAIAILALFKAFEKGKPSILVSFTNLYVLVVLFISIFILGESLSILQIVGSIVLIISAIILIFEDLKSFKLESGILFAIITIFGWGYYYSFIKVFVPVFGTYMTTFFLEMGDGVLVILYVLIFKREEISPPSREDAKLIYFRSSMVFFASLLFTYSVGSIGSALTSAINSSSSIFTAISSYFLLKEKLDFIKYVSIALMVIGLILVFLG